MSPLTALCHQASVTIIGIDHFSKDTKRKAIHRSMGSVAFVAAARAAWIVVPDPADESRRLFLPVKNNLAETAGLAYRIIDGRVVWDSAGVNGTADEILGGTPRTKKLDEACTWLTEQLAYGPVARTDIIEAGKKIDLPERTIARAFREINGVSEKRFGGGSQWSLR